jgi:hypothetical protein
MTGFRHGSEILNSFVDSEKFSIIIIPFLLRKVNFLKNKAKGSQDF